MTLRGLEHACTTTPGRDVLCNGNGMTLSTGERPGSLYRGKKEGLGFVPPDESLPCAAEVPSVRMFQQLTITGDKVKRHFAVGRFAYNAGDSRAHLCG